MSPSEAARLASLARRFDLAGSCASDFHEPGLPWRPLGRFAKLPEGVVPITERLGLATPGTATNNACTAGPMKESGDNVDRELFRNMQKLRALRIEHRDLDEVIARLSLDIHIDELQLKRLKKRKLVLKDQILMLESQLIPDLNA